MENVKYPKKLKDQKFTFVKIKITKIRSAIEEFKGATSFKDKMYIAEIDKGYATTSFNAKTMNQLLKQIKEEIGT